jgi:hypothetical protein
MHVTYDVATALDRPRGRASSKCVPQQSAEPFVIGAGTVYLTQSVNTRTIQIGNTTQRTKQRTRLGRSDAHQPGSTRRKLGSTQVPAPHGATPQHALAVSAAAGGARGAACGW